MWGLSGGEKKGKGGRNLFKLSYFYPETSGAHRRGKRERGRPLHFLVARRGGRGGGVVFTLGERERKITLPYTLRNV